MKLTHKEFAAHIGKEPKNLYTYLGRKEIVKEGDYYDTDNEVNRLFIEKIAAKYGLPGAKTVVNTDIPEEKEEEKTAKRGKKAVIQGPNTEYQRLLENRVQVDIDMKQRRIELYAIELARKKGSMIPVAPMFGAIKSLSQFMMVAMKTAMEKIVIDLAHKYDISAEDVAAIRGTIIKELNAGNIKAVEMTVSNIDTIINEHSEQGRPGKSKN